MTKDKLITGLRELCANEMINTSAVIRKALPHVPNKKIPEYIGRVNGVRPLKATEAGVIMKELILLAREILKTSSGIVPGNDTDAIYEAAQSKTKEEFREYMNQK